MAADSEEGEIDLEPERRQYVTDVYAQLDTITHYALLGVNRMADKKAIKNAYYRLAGLVHTDRYFGKRLGSYKAKMEAIFARTSLAYEILSSTEKRQKYDALLDEALAQIARHGNGAAVQAAPVDPRVAAKRQAARDGLREHFAAGKAKAQEYAQVAVRALAAGNIVGAIEAYRSALGFAPNDPQLAAALADAERAAGDKLAESHRRKAMLEERFGRWAAAAESWQRVMSAKPDDPDVHARLANALARARGGAG
jgi:curved DNA-binding protein CbpA